MFRLFMDFRLVFFCDCIIIVCYNPAAGCHTNKPSIYLNDEKFSLGRVKSKKICRHPGADVGVSEQSGGGRYLSQSCEDGTRKIVEYHLLFKTYYRLNTGAFQ